MKNISPENLVKYFLSSGEQATVQGNNFFPIENKNTSNMLNATRTTSKIIARFFSPINVLASKPVYTFKPHSVVVHVFYYIPVAGQALNNNTVNNLGDTLSTLFKRPVVLQLVKLHYPYLNSYILAQYIAANAINYKLVRIVRRVFSYVGPVKNTKSFEVLASVKPSQALPALPALQRRAGRAVVGIKVRLSGRLVTERSRPRQTVQTAQIGSFSKSNISLVDKGSFTTKNKKGAFTIKVWISQQAVV